MLAPSPSARREVRRGIAALVVVQFCFALFPIFAAFAFQRFAPSAVAFWRIAGGSAILLTLAFAVYGRAAWIRREDLWHFVGCSWLGVALNQGLFLEGLARSTPIHSGLVMCLIPVLTYGIAVLLRRERMNRVRAVGILIAMGGSAPLFLARAADGSATLSAHAFGNALMFANAIAYSLYLVFAKRLLERTPALVFVAWIYALSLPSVFWFGHGVDVAPSWDGAEKAWLAIGYAVLFPTVIAYLFNGYALARVPASTTAFFIYMQPVITAVASRLVLGERFQPQLVMTAACLFVGLGLVLQRRW